MTEEKDNEIPESGAVFTYGRSRFAENEPNRFWIRDDPITNVICGDEHTAVLTEKGRLFTFGSNDWGQLGHGNTKAHTSPTSVKAFKGERILNVACGKAHTLVYLESDTVYAFGCNEEGQLGTGDYDSTAVPKEVRELRGERLLQLAAGAQHSMALTSDGHVLVWGCHADGQLGLGRGDEQYPLPTDMQLKHQILQIACGYHHSALLTVSGDLYTFGDGENGRLGLGHDRTVSSPHKIAGIPDDKVEHVACGGDHTAFVTSTARLYVFGSNSNGQLGLGQSKHAVDVPTPVEKLSGTQIKHVACGYNHTAVISDLHCLYVFGDGRYGKLGVDGRDTIHPAPKRVDRFSRFDVTQVACGGSHTIILAEPCLNWKRREEQAYKSSRRLKFRDVSNSEDEGLPESEESYPGGGARAARRRHKEEQQHSSQHRMSKSLDLGASAREHDMRAHGKLPPLTIDRGRARYDSDNDTPDSSDEGIGENRKEKAIARFRRHSTSSQDSEENHAAYRKGPSSRREEEEPRRGRAKDTFLKANNRYESHSEESEEEAERKSSLRRRARSRSASDDESGRYQQNAKNKRLARRGSFDVPPSKSKLLQMEKEETDDKKKSPFPSWLFKKKAEIKDKKNHETDDRIKSRRGRKDMFAEDDEKDSRAKTKSKTCVIS